MMSDQSVCEAALKAMSKLAPRRENRLRSYALGRLFLMQIFAAWDAKHLTLPRFPSIPPDAEVRGLYTDLHHRIIMLVAHESFDIVPDGCEIPVFEVASPETVVFDRVFEERKPKNATSVRYYATLEDLQKLEAAPEIGPVIRLPRENEMLYAAEDIEFLKPGAADRIIQQKNREKNAAELARKLLIDDSPAAMQQRADEFIESQPPLHDKFPPFTKKLMAEQGLVACPDCRGTGEYRGLECMEVCKRCAGRRVIPAS